MSATTKIEWCDSTFNPVIGCNRISLGCDDCYAARSMPALLQGIKWGAGQARKRTAVANWKLPERWNDKPFYACSCGARGESPFPCSASGYCDGIVAPARRRVFCASLADWLDNEWPIEWLVDLLDLIRRTPNLDWLLLTKRIGNWRKRLDAAYDCVRPDPAQPESDLAKWIGNWLCDAPPANVWIGATVVNQAEADRDVPKLLIVPARVRFLSIEPMLGPVNLTHMDVELAGHREWCWINALTGEQTDMGRPCPDVPRLHWIIAGGESGPRARPSHPDWYRSLRDQCAAAGAPFLFKQWGEWNPGTVQEAVHAQKVRVELSGDVHPWPPVFDAGSGPWCMSKVGKKAAGRQLYRIEHNAFPVVIQ